MQSAAESKGQETILEMRNVYAGYGPIEVLRGVSLSVKQGEIVTLIGPNGAGKTTTLRAISGQLLNTRGYLSLCQQCIDGFRPESLVRLGIAMVDEKRLLFPTMSVHDNLLLGAYHRLGREKMGKVKSDFDNIFRLFPVLQKRAKQLAGTLSGGEQQMLAIGRALMSKPRLLLLDEPSLGIAPLLVRELMKAVAELRQGGMSILLVEQNARAALSIADRGYVLQKGEICLEGCVTELLVDKGVKDAYLGKTKQEA